MLRLLRPPLAASFLRSFRLHSPRYARETIAKNLLARVALVTASMTRTGSRARNAAPPSVLAAAHTCSRTEHYSPRSFAHEHLFHDAQARGVNDRNVVR